MSSIHGHEVLQMMIDSQESYTKQSLTQAITDKFGSDARFHTCSANDLTAAELVDFLEHKRKFIPVDSGFITNENKICKH